MAICFPMIHGHLRCTQGRPYSQQSPLCSSFTGSQSPVCWIRQQSSKICIGHCAFELSRLMFGFTFVMALYINYVHLTFLCAVSSQERIPQGALSCVNWGCALWQTCCVTLNALGPQFPYQHSEGFGHSWSSDSVICVSMNYPSGIPWDIHISLETENPGMMSWQHFFHFYLWNICWMPACARHCA